MFKQLLEQGVPKTEVDGQPLSVLRHLAQQGNQNQVRKLQSTVPGFVDIPHPGFDTCEQPPQ